MVKKPTEQRPNTQEEILRQLAEIQRKDREAARAAPVKAPATPALPTVPAVAADLTPAPPHRKRAKKSGPEYRTLFDAPTITPARVEVVLEDLDLCEDFIRPQQPNPDFIQMIHGYHPGYICLVRKRTAAEKDALPPDFPVKARDVEQLVSIPNRSLPGLFPQMIEALGVDSYFTLNGMNRGHYMKNKRGFVNEHGELLPHGYRNNIATTWLCTAWADMDCDEHGLTIGQAFGAIIDAVAEKRIPRPSILSDSGNGCWAFWLLRGASPMDPVKVTFETLPLWQFTIGKIRNTFYNLGADTSIDPSRVCRIPGSINSSTKAGRKVSYLPWYDANGVIRTYQLPDLARAFGIDPERVPPQPPPEPVIPSPPILRIDTKRSTPTKPTPKPPASSAVKNAAKSEYGRRGWVKKWQNERDRFYELLRIRGGFKKPYRNKAVLVLATILHKLNRANPEKVREEIFQDLFPHLEQGRELYTKDEASVAILSVFKGPPVDKAGNVFHLGQVRIANELNITPAEAEQVGWPPAAVFGGPAPRPELSEVAARNKARIKDRREKIKAIVAARGADVKIPEIRGRLAELGVEAYSPRIVMLDLHALVESGEIQWNGIRPPKSPDTRPKLFE